MPWQRGVIPGHAAAAIAEVRTRTGRGRDPLIIGHHAAPFLRARSPGSAASSRSSHAVRPFGRCVTRRERASERAQDGPPRRQGADHEEIPAGRRSTDRICVRMDGQYGQCVIVGLAKSSRRFFQRPWFAAPARGCHQPPRGRSCDELLFAQRLIPSRAVTLDAERGLKADVAGDE